MKIVLVVNEDESGLADRFRPLWGKMKVSAETFPLKPPEDKDVKRQFSALSALICPEEKDKETYPTHVVVLSPIAQRWLDFLAGLSCGTALPFLAYGEKAIEAIPVEFASFFRPIKTENAMRDYLDYEYEAFDKWKTANEVIKARETLLQMGIPVNGESLANCSGEGGIREVALFLAAGFSPDTRNKAGVPLLNISARRGNWEILRLLLHTGAQLNLQADDRGTSALIDSVMSKHYGMASDLIKAGADLNIKSKDGQTALVVAVGAGDEKIVEALLKAGADPDIADSMGVSARTYASLFHKDAITNLIDALSPQKSE